MIEQPRKIRREIKSLRNERQELAGPNHQRKERIKHLRGRYRTLKFGPQAPDSDPKAPNEVRPDKHKGPDNQGKPKPDKDKPKPTPTPTPTPTESKWQPAPIPQDILDKFSPFSSFVPQPGQPDPRDATYWRDLSRLTLEKDAELSRLNTEEILSQTQYERDKGDLNEALPWQVQGNRKEANRAGGLYSSVTGNREGNILTDYTRNVTDLESGFRNEQEVREFLRHQIDSGYSIDEAAALAESIARASEAELSRPAPVKPGDVGDKVSDIMGKGKKNNDKSKNPDKRIAELRKRLKTAKGKEKTRIRRQIRKAKEKSNG